MASLRGAWKRGRVPVRRGVKGAGPVAVLIAGVMMVIVAASVLAGHPEIFADPVRVLSELTERHAAKPAEWLFFLGAAFLCLLSLQRRHPIRAASALLTGVAWFVVYRPFSSVLNSLGVDSFAETNDFDIEEAKFWLKTLGDVISLRVNVKLFALYTALSIASFAVLQWLSNRAGWGTRKDSIVKLSIALVLIGSAVYQTVSGSISMYFRNSAGFLAVRQNFSATPPPIGVDDTNVNVLVYIGESTAVVNLELYGYSRKTTPRLSRFMSEDPKLLVFHGTFSTHTHTSQSLLEALSFAIDKDEEFLPITERRRVSIVDLLSAGGIETFLVSNQGMTGAWNQAASIIFRNAKKVFSIDSRIAGNQDRRMRRPWDHDFFDQRIVKSSPEWVGNKALVFFHSYAGHGAYLDNIPEPFRRPVDNSFDERNADWSVRIGAGRVEDVEAYDSAMRYVDHAVADALEFVKGRKQPTIFVYFSDHGEAVFSGRGHDSSRFVCEMARVPLLVYFNEAARRDRPALFEKYRKLALQGNASTLAQLPSTLLDLLGARVGSGRGHALVQPAMIGEKTILPPLLVRETEEGVTYIDINQPALDVPAVPGRRFIDKTDDATRACFAAAGYRGSASGGHGTRDDLPVSASVSSAVAALPQ